VVKGKRQCELNEAETEALNGKKCKYR